ncbi:NACHT, LRR and PYD domains-containing protein 3-like [Rana temporaria]|uniref:NACHT, LRR and PYD domains-containing protein 3-like n=1 Tax=Rana temporaria TaxID=8407 RepID=UPI001AAD07AC|nr:NACHT, LRR and PYD domains-containing protein 3-like [Rana temporaria]
MTDPEVCGTMEESPLTDPELCSTMAECSLTDLKSKYLASIKEVFQPIEEHACHQGKVVGGRYPRLRTLKINKGEHPTIPFSGTLLEQAEVTKSSERYSPSSVQDLFVPDGSGFVPKTLVLVGPPGIGKTLTTQRIMLDWASGKLYADQFNFVFYLSGRQINKITGNVNIEGLVTKSTKLQFSENLIKSALDDPSKVLIVIDGFNELRWTLEDDEEDCEDPFEKTHKETLLKCLLSKEILSDVSLLITSRSMSLKKLKDFARSSSSVELLGFSEGDLEQFFHHFFNHKDQAEQAFSVLKENQVLLGLSSVPLTCWLVCRILKAGMKDELSSANCKTLTSVYLSYLRSVLLNPGSTQPILQCLKNLCALANDGILNQRSLFDVEDLERNGLTLSEVTSVFPNDGIFQKNVEDPTNYSFIHLSVQEFFAALYYVLGEDAEVKETKGVHGDAFLPRVCSGRSLFYESERHPYLSSTIQFLFGLLNSKQLKELAEVVGSSVSLRAKSAMEICLTAGKPFEFCPDVLTCFYEAQDEALRSRVFSAPDLLFQSCFYSSFMENVRIREMLYCLGDRASFVSIRLEDHLMQPKDLELMSPSFHGSSKLSFTRCGFAEDLETGGKASWLSNPDSKIQELEFHVCVVAPSFFEDLCSLISSSRSLTKLVISHHALEDSALRTFCDGLRQPGCTLRELSLDDCNLTASGCEILTSAMKENRSLHKLDLALNKVEDEGMRFLCEGLKDPGCTLQELRMEFCELTPACGDFLHSALMTNRSLTTLCLRDCGLQDSGTKLLCEALCQPGCTLKELVLFEVNLTSASCEDLRSVILANRTLTSLNVRDNNLGDSGVKTLCEGLRDPGCTLQELMLSSCELTQASCEDLRSVLLTNRSLTKLSLAWNSLENSGVKVLCEGLRDPCCPLQELDLYGCDLSSLEDLSSVITTNRSLAKLDLAGNRFTDSGVKPLCEALRNPDCIVQTLRVGYCELTASCAEEVMAVINKNRSLNELEVTSEVEGPPTDLESVLAKFKHPSITVEKNNTQDGLFIYIKYKKQE